MTMKDKQIVTCTDLEPLDLDHVDKIKPYLRLRDIESCEFGLTTLFLWKSRNNPHMYFDKNYMLIFGHFDDKCYSQMPLCKEEYFMEAFEKVKEMFARFDKSLIMYSVNKEFADFVEKEYPGEYEITCSRDYADYIYDGARLRNLPGKKLRKKRNHINAFIRDYEGRYSFRILNGKDRDDVNTCLETWIDNIDATSARIDNEIEGIDFVLEHEEILDASVFGIYIDDKLEALSIGSLINGGREVIIHVEKANSEIRGLYPFLSKTFLNEIYPDVELVNREEDLGIPGLRKSKESYEPLRMEDKYEIRKVK
ncbi:hypothetical protein SAMN02745751_03484 [Dethiosulfatibacter aminovorans DSM 17477]|uniref:Phosphatidylglycerol lysyltransferase C-terminal domain-containing protein n=1 Tax=Dethiosulfatibacter aminovorans DSM 17477 TaxID=1121476 RepID=A0A1M6MIH5_9FIRM|nr:phosphatidylglycerol lysyltransferase domain-containing protein [Dethiosulfatibacter aminovorans]SHJ83321.1 hypothetical protein SAMN02745751_03484 [Dethiosulfatibacter aminovorans DSM 17477]